MTQNYLINNYNLKEKWNLLFHTTQHQLYVEEGLTGLNSEGQTFKNGKNMSIIKRVKEQN